MSSAPVLDSMPVIIRKIPKFCLKPQLSRSLLFLVRDYFLAALLVSAICLVDSWLVGPILGLVLGVVITGIFVVGHDAGHRSFCNSERINNLVGHLTMTVGYWPFHVWRLSHDIHHRGTHHIDREIAWVPFTYEKYKHWPKLAQMVYLHSRSTLYFIGSMFFSAYFVKDGRRGKKSTHFKAAELDQVNFSLKILYVWLVVSIGGAFYFAGFYGFVCLIVLPQLGFHFWLSTFTYFHHTHKEVTFMAAEEWTMEKAQLASTIHVKYPRIVEWVCHDINWHVPHHVCVGIPHYHLKAAHSSLKAAYPELVREEVFNWQLIADTVSNCHFIKSKKPADMNWISLEENEALAHSKNLEFVSS